MSSLLIPPTIIPPSLDPLRASYEDNDVESELKAAIIQVFEDTLRAAERRINTYGTPHRGDFVTVERFVKAAGLALERKDSREAFMSELFRTWVARNPRRGTAFLETYLQLLWPGQWALSQQWQDPALPYGQGMGGEQAGWFLTSRLLLVLTVDDEGSLSKLAGSFRAVLPAKFVLQIAVRRSFQTPLTIGMTYLGSTFETYVDSRL